MPKLPQWIARTLAADPPRAKSLVVTVFGDAVLPRARAVWLGTLIEMMAAFGVNERLVRSSVFRLARDGWLAVEREGRRSRYGFTAEGRARFERAHALIYHRRERGWRGEWTLVVAAGERRRELEWEGFRALVPGLYAHPAPKVALGEDAIVLRARSEGLRGWAHTAWDLREVGGEYRRFCRRFAPLLELEMETPETAFVARTLSVHAYRRARLHDPLLPGELLPGDWPAGEAYRLWREVYRRASPQTGRYLRKVRLRRA